MATTKIPVGFGKVTSKLHTAIYKATNGKLGGKFGSAPVIVLGTVGRKSGKPRETPLFAIDRSGGWAISASNSGHDKAPDWYYNLMASGTGSVLANGTSYPVTARVAEGDERAEIWAGLVAVYADYEAYTEVTDRVFPLVVLEKEQSA